MHKQTTSTILSLPVSIASIRHPERLEVLGITGTRRYGAATDVTLKVRCGCFRIFEASRIQIQQGLVTCCDACAFIPADATAAVRQSRAPRCNRGTR